MITAHACGVQVPRRAALHGTAQNFLKNAPLELSHGATEAKFNILMSNRDCNERKRLVCMKSVFLSKNAFPGKKHDFGGGQAGKGRGVLLAKIGQSPPLYEGPRLQGFPGCLEDFSSF